MYVMLTDIILDNSTKFYIISNSFSSRIYIFFLWCLLVYIKMNVSLSLLLQTSNMTSSCEKPSPEYVSNTQ